MKTVCLATPVEAPERYAAAQAHFAAVGLPIHRYVQGLHKTTSGLVTTHPYMVDRPQPDAEPYFMGPHPVNIWLGHYMIWQALLCSDDPQWFVVECDARFPAGWSYHFTRAMDEAPKDYDLVYMGSCCTVGRPRTEIAHWDAHGLYQLATTAPQCNHAYVVTRAAAEVLCTTLRKVWAPIDIQQASECWGDTLPRAVEVVAPPSRRLNVYTVLPRLVSQENTELPE